MLVGRSRFSPALLSAKQRLASSSPTGSVNNICKHHRHHDRHHHLTLCPLEMQIVKPLRRSLFQRSMKGIAGEHVIAWAASVYSK